MHARPETTGRRSLRRALVAVAATALAACAGASRPAPAPAAVLDVEAALGYLASTPHEVGADVVFAVQVFAARTSDASARRLAERLRARLAPADRDAYAALWSLETPVLPALAPRALRAAAEVRSGPPAPDVSDALIGACIEGVLRCEVAPPCAVYVGIDGLRDRDLTHQALWLLFAHWRGCQTRVDTEARRLALAARVLAEREADPRVDDLGLERLVVLAELGGRDSIGPEDLRAVAAAQQPEGCFPASATTPCHPHPTGLALWLAAALRAAR